MKKKCIAIAKKAMVWTLAATMLVATPLTASAAGLRGVYKVEDQYGEELDGTNPTRTGTVSSTNTDSKTLDSTVEAKIVGIVLSQTKVELETGMGVSEAQKNAGVKLEATVITEGELKDDVRKELERSFTWRSEDTDIATIFNHKKDGTTNEMTVRAKKGGDTKITVSLDNNKKGIHFTQTVDVHVKEYASKLELVNCPKTAFVKHTLDLSKYLVPTSASANDTVTWSVECASGVATITDAGVVTFKKWNKTDNSKNKVVVYAVPERGVAASAEITIEEGVPANKIEIQNTSNEKITKGDLDIGQTGKEELKVKAVMTAKEEGKVVTDTVTWSSNKPAVIDVSSIGETDNNEEVTLIASAPGKAVITAKASSGKSAKITVTVKATLTGLEVTTESGKNTAYSGQKVQMVAKTTPAVNNEGVKWSIEKVQIDGKDKADPNASINAKGLLTIKNKVTDNAVVTVKATSKKPTDLIQADVKKGTVEKVGNKNYITATYAITVTQSNITSIEVRELGVEDPLASFKVGVASSANVKNKKSDIYVPKNKNYVATVEGTGGVDSLTWTSSNAKVAEITGIEDGKATIKAVKSGTATITVSGINVTKRDDNGIVKASKVIKASFKVNVIQPVTELTMNKTSVVLKNTGKKQTVSVTAKANKNNAKDKIKYSVAIVNAAETTTVPTIAKDTKGSVVFEAGKYSAGDEFVITARTVNSGATARTYVKVVSPSFAVVLNGSDGNAIGSKKALTGYGAEKALTVVPKINLKAKKADPDVLADPNETKDGKVAADVDYTANKKGIVQIVKNDDGSAQIIRLKKGTVVVTVKTTDGKQAKVTLTDK